MAKVCGTEHNFKSEFKCGICHSELCKACVEILEEETFSFWVDRPETLKHLSYCSSCFTMNVQDSLELYQQKIELAKTVNVFLSKQSKETRLIKRIEKPVLIENCIDYDEALLRLAFLAVNRGYNGIIDVDLRSKKVKLSGYQTTVWSGSAVPCNLN
jgi:hypothetical protein